MARSKKTQRRNEEQTRGCKERDYTWPTEKPLYAFVFRTHGPAWPYIDRLAEDGVIEFSKHRFLGTPGMDGSHRFEIRIYRPGIYRYENLRFPKDDQMHHILGSEGWFVLEANRSIRRIDEGQAKALIGSPEAPNPDALPYPKTNRPPRHKRIWGE